MSYMFTLTGASSKLEQYFKTPVILKKDKEYEIGLIEYHSYNSIPNVVEKNNVIKIGPHTIRFPVGAYEITQINDYIIEKLKGLEEKVEFELCGNESTMKCEIRSSLPVDLTDENSLAPILGFQKKVLPAFVKHVSELPVNIMTVNDISIVCEFPSIYGTYRNGDISQEIYAFSPDTRPGGKFIQKPKNIMYFPVNNYFIPKISLNVVDQKGESIDFRGEEITIRVHLRQTT